MVHSAEWTTGSRLFGAFDTVSAFSEELVVHSTEWTTSSRLCGNFALVSAFLLAFQAGSLPFPRLLINFLSRAFVQNGPFSGIYI